MQDHQQPDGEVPSTPQQCPGPLWTSRGHSRNNSFDDPVTSATRSVVEASQAICNASAASIAAALAKLHAAAGPTTTAAANINGVARQAAWGRSSWPQLGVHVPEATAAGLMAGCCPGVLSPQPSASSCFGSPPASPLVRGGPVPGQVNAQQQHAVAGSAVHIGLAGRLASPPPVVTLVAGGSPYRTVTLHSLPLAAALAQSGPLQITQGQAFGVSPMQQPYGISYGQGSGMYGLGVQHGPQLASSSSAFQHVWGVRAAAGDASMPPPAPFVANRGMRHPSDMGPPGGRRMAGSAAPSIAYHGNMVQLQQLHIPSAAAAMAAAAHELQQPDSPGSACSDSVSPAAAGRAAAARAEAAPATTAAAHEDECGKEQQEVHSSQGASGGSSTPTAAALRRFQQQLKEELTALREQQVTRLVAVQAKLQAPHSAVGSGDGDGAAHSSAAAGVTEEELLGLQQGLAEQVDQLQERLAAQCAALEEQLA